MLTITGAGNGTLSKSSSSSWELVFLSCTLTFGSCFHFSVYLTCLPLLLPLSPLFWQVPHFSKQMNQSSINYTIFDMSSVSHSSCLPTPRVKKEMFSFFFRQGLIKPRLASNLPCGLDIELPIPLPPSSRHWDARCVPPLWFCTHDFN